MNHRLPAFRRGPALLTPLFLLLLASCDATAISGQFQRIFVEHQGTTRTTHLFIPSSVTDRPNVPLVLAFHGAGGSGPLFRDQIDLDRQAHDDGFVVAYPTATGVNWAEGCGCIRPDLDGVDDVGFADAVIEAVADVVEIDRSRIFAIGYSQGAVFLHHLACQRTATYAGFASIAGMMNGPVAASCPADVPVDMLLVHGSEDTVLPFDGQEAGSSSLLSVPATMLAWRDNNGCSAGADRTTEKIGDFDVDARRYETCEEGTRVRLFELLGHGHSWPSGIESEIAGFFGLTRTD
ncbi:MAG: hypothetical protein RIE53_13130 [Rhodothermales bacterium]